MQAKAEARYIRISPQKARLVVDLNEDVDVDQLYVSEAYVNEGPRMKRVRPAPMGRAYRYQRRLAHIVIKVTEKEAQA
jgi:large subunit ribosomal protein L22